MITIDPYQTSKGWYVPEGWFTVHTNLFITRDHPCLTWIEENINGEFGRWDFGVSITLLFELEEDAIMVSLRYPPPEYSPWFALAEIYFELEEDAILVSMKYPLFGRVEVDIAKVYAPYVPSIVTNR